MSENPDPFELIDEGATDQVKALLNSHSLVVDDDNGVGDTLLSYAIKRGQFDLAHYLLQHNADVTIADGTGQTPLHLAAARDAIDLLPELLSRQPTLNATDDLGMTPLLIAARAGNREFAKELVRHGASYDIHSAAALGDHQRVKTLIETDPGCIRTARYVHDILPDAIYANSVECVALLVQHPDIDVDGFQLSGEPPIVAAASTSSIDPAIVRLLLDAGADRNVRSSSGTTARDRARLVGRADILALLG